MTNPMRPMAGIIAPPNRDKWPTITRPMSGMVAAPRKDDNPLTRRPMAGMISSLPFFSPVLIVMINHVIHSNLSKCATLASLGCFAHLSPQSPCILIGQVGSSCYLGGSKAESKSRSSCFYSL